jgi:hypothetical protein
VLGEDYHARDMSVSAVQGLLCLKRTAYLNLCNQRICWNWLPGSRELFSSRNTEQTWDCVQHDLTLVAYPHLTPAMFHTSTV